jgi:hypothetical protein
MNSLKGFGAIAVLATIVLALSLVTRVHLVVVVVTTGMIISFTATYIAAIIRYRRDRFIASGGQSAYAWDGTAGPRPNARRRVHPALVIALVLVVLGAGGAFYGVWKLHPSNSGLAQAAGRASASVLTVKYRTDTPPTAPVARPWLEVVNTSANPVALRDVKLRYYFKADDGVAYAANCVQTALLCSNITESIGKMLSPTPEAKSYLEVGFTAGAGTLAPGQTSQGIGLQLYRLDHKPLNQANDRSFNAAVAQYAPSNLVTAYVDGVLGWGDEPSSQEPAPSASAPQAAAAPTTGVIFDNFHYTGYADPALAANGWGGRTGKGGPGIADTWSTAGISFPADDTAQGGQALQLQLTSDGTQQGTQQTELLSTRPIFRTGTLAARIYFTDKPTDGPNGDHINETFAPISPSAASTNYSELDYEYMPNGGWGAPGPRLDTTSWRSSKQGDRATSHQNNHLAGWHIMMITAVNGTVTYSVDGHTVFTSNGKTFPREQMQVHFSTWLVDLPFGGQRTWSMRVNWFYQADSAMSMTEVQSAVDALYASGINHINTVAG